MSAISELTVEYDRRCKVAEYHALRILLSKQASTDIWHHVTVILGRLNPKYNYRDKEFCRERAAELEREIYDEFGREREL